MPTTCPVMSRTCVVDSSYEEIVYLKVLSSNNSFSISLFPFARAICGHFSPLALQSHKPGTNMSAKAPGSRGIADAKRALSDT